LTAIVFDASGGEIGDISPIYIFQVKLEKCKEKILTAGSNKDTYNVM